MIDADAIQSLADMIARRFEPEKIILFGSHAGGSPTEDSDVDLLVVMEYEGGQTKQAVRILCEAEPPFACDLVVYRPDELAKRYAEFNPIAREALDRGKVLYDRRSAPVAG